MVRRIASRTVPCRSRAVRPLLHAGTVALGLLFSACETARVGIAPAEGDPEIAAERTLAIDGEFGSIQAVAVDGTGRIFAADRMAQQIHVFSPAGAPLVSVGRKGRGPGEYTGIQDVVAARGDSLFVLDAILQRVSVYSTENSPAELAYTTDVSSRLPGRATGSLLLPSTGGMVLQYTVPFSESNLDTRREIVVRRLDGRGALLKDSLLVAPDREFLTTRDPQYGYSVSHLPFGRTSILRLGTDDRLYYGWSDSLAIEVYSLDGARVRRIAAPYEPSRVTQEDWRALLDSYESEFPRKLMQRAFDGGKIPSTKPAFKDFLVDDRGRAWISVVTSEDVQVSSEVGLRYAGMPGRTASEDGSPWWVLDRNGERVATVTFPRNAALHAIRDEHAYGVETDALGVQRIVRYRIPE